MSRRWIHVESKPGYATRIDLDEIVAVEYSETLGLVYLRGGGVLYLVDHLEAQHVEAHLDEEPA